MFGSVIGGQGSLNLEEEDIEDMHEVFNMIDLVAGRFGDAFFLIRCEKLLYALEPAAHGNIRLNLP
jgi:hypothetical protein